MKVAIRGDVDEKAIAQLERCARAGRAPLAAQMADGHYGYSMSIGGVIGFREYVSPSSVGYDIGCGNKAVLTNLTVGEIDGDVGRIMDEITKRIDFGGGPGYKPTAERADHPVLDEIREADYVPQRALAELAAAQLGSIGGGNHYVDLFADEHGRVWVGVHFGSRGFGHRTAEEFLTLGKTLDINRENSEDMDSPPTLLPIESGLGQSYVAAMELAGRYAYAGRDVAVQRVLGILGAEPLHEVHNHHNYAWHEQHETDTGLEMLWVVRKGATPAFPGQEGFVGATMGEPSVILAGKGGPAASMLMFSTVHGAGRVMSRTRAAGKTRKRWTCNTRDCNWFQPPRTHKPEACPSCGNTSMTKRFVKISEGEIDWSQTLAGLRASGIELRGGAADEAPLAYKRLDQVLDAHSDTIEILHTLTPLGVAMAGSEIAADD
jgi:tRNA-splicing ligase RtcB